MPPAPEPLFSSLTAGTFLKKFGPASQEKRAIGKRRRTLYMRAARTEAD
jgi:hypothetical protein